MMGRMCNGNQKNFLGRIFMGCRNYKCSNGLSSSFEMDQPNISHKMTCLRALHDQNNLNLLLP